MDLHGGRYNPDNVLLRANDFVIRDFAEGSFLTFEYNTPEKATIHVGPQGDTTYAQQKNRSANLTIMIHINSSSSLELDRLYHADANFVLTLVSKQGLNQIGIAPDCRVVQHSSGTLEAEGQQNHEYVIVVPYWEPRISTA